MRDKEGLILSCRLPFAVCRLATSKRRAESGAAADRRVAGKGGANKGCRRDGMAWDSLLVANVTSGIVDRGAVQRRLQLEPGFKQRACETEIANRKQNEGAQGQKVAKRVGKKKVQGRGE